MLANILQRQARPVLTNTPRWTPAAASRALSTTRPLSEEVKAVKEKTVKEVHPPNRRIFTNFPPGAKAVDIAQLFAKFGEIEKVKRIPGWNMFVTFKEQEAADDAVKAVVQVPTRLTLGYGAPPKSAVNATPPAEKMSS